jgi:hypothetical protein
MQIQNIQDNPVTGIGFQLASIPKRLQVVTDPYLGLPIQAPVEKGNIFTAIVEENGILGAIGFIIFLFILAKRAKRNKPIEILALFTAALATNIGEATFFSFGGMGLFIWLIIGLSVCSKPNTTHKPALAD